MKTKFYEVKDGQLFRFRKGAKVWRKVGDLAYKTPGTSDLESWRIRGKGFSRRVITES